MNLNQLKIFVQVCEEKTMTRAAAKLFITQPAISHMIRELEKEIGFSLFDREGKKIYLNEEGRIFLEKTRKVLAEYDELASGLRPAPLRIGSCITIANFWLPTILKAATAQHIPYQVYVDKQEAILDRITRHELDIALIEGEISHAHLQQTPFSEYELKVVCSMEHPFAKRTTCSLQEICAQPLYLREQGSAIREVWESALRLHHLSAAPVLTSVNSQALLAAVKENLGITILPWLLVKNDADVACIAIEECRLCNVNRLVYHKEKYLSENFQALVAIILKEKEPH